MPGQLIDSPSPFAPTKQLRDFLAEWEGTEEAKKDPILRLQLRQVREALADRQGKPDIY